MSLNKSPEAIANMMEAEPSLSEITRNLHITANASHRRQAHAAEVALKGLFVDHVFKQLNVTRYR